METFELLGRSLNHHQLHYMQHIMSRYYLILYTQYLSFYTCSTTASSSPTHSPHSPILSLKPPPDCPLTCAFHLSTPPRSLSRHHAPHHYLPNITSHLFHPPLPLTHPLIHLLIHPPDIHPVLRQCVFHFSHYH